MTLTYHDSSKTTTIYRVRLARRNVLLVTKDLKQERYRCVVRVLSQEDVNERMPLTFTVARAVNFRTATLFASHRLRTDRSVESTQNESTVICVTNNHGGTIISLNYNRLSPKRLNSSETAVRNDSNVPTRADLSSFYRTPRVDRKVAKIPKPDPCTELLRSGPDTATSRTGAANVFTE